MYHKLKSTIDSQLKAYTAALDTTYSLNKISPVLSKSIKAFILGKGKRIRPILFIIGYLGFTKKIAPFLYRCALSFELLHDYMLVHDDIIDKSKTRRGLPTMHVMFEDYLKKYKKLKFNGQDLAIVCGDMIYAMAIDNFLSIKEDTRRKEKAMRYFIQAAFFTGLGEFLELLSGIKTIDQTTKADIYRIYDYKTAHYTFASCLCCGAILAGANQKQSDLLYRYGISLGRAFQIKDDILGLFGEENLIGKSPLTDLQEAKKTLLIWHAYHRSDRKGKLIIDKVFSKQKVIKADLCIIRQIVTNLGSLAYAQKEVASLLQKAQALIQSSGMRKEYKLLLQDFCRETLKLE